jgi:hypothetical protein
MSTCARRQQRNHMTYRTFHEENMKAIPARSAPYQPAPDNTVHSRQRTLFDLQRGQHRAQRQTTPCKAHDNTVQSRRRHVNLRQTTQGKADRRQLVTLQGRKVTRRQTTPCKADRGHFVMMPSHERDTAELSTLRLPAMYDDMTSRAPQCTQVAALGLA